MSGRTQLKYDPDTIVKVCQESTSMSEAARRLGVRLNTLRKIATALNCYQPNQHSRPIGYIPRHVDKKSLELYYFSNIKHIAPSNLRKILLREGIKEKRCELCNNTEWLGREIPLELHHKDGNRYNNSLDNLMILCPTCHAWITNGSNLKADTFTRTLVDSGAVAVPKSPDGKVVVRCRRNRIDSEQRTRAPRKPIEQRTCSYCGKVYTPSKNRGDYCSRACAQQASQKFDVTAEELLGMFRETPNYTKIGKQLGVTANAVKKRCKRLGIYDEVSKLIQEEKVNRCLSSCANIKDRSSYQYKITERLKARVDYYVGYTITDGVETIKYRFFDKEEVIASGMCPKVICRVCRGECASYRGLMWRREPKTEADINNMGH